MVTAQLDLCCEFDPGMQVMAAAQLSQMPRLSVLMLECRSLGAVLLLAASAAPSLPPDDALYLKTFETREVFLLHDAGFFRVMSVRCLTLGVRASKSCRAACCTGR
jgi:hypothetical protein